jgi:light-regulated signal transduction histidine kinase (bacteriophytochrome)
VIAIAAFIIKQRELAKEKENNQLIRLKNKKLSELNQKKKKIIGIASHDLSTPLASIDMWSQLLKSNNDNLSEEQKKSTDMIQEAVHYGQKLLKKIVDLENVIPDKISIDRFDFGTYIAAIVENLKAETKRNIKWNSNISAPVYLVSDRALIKKMCEAVLSKVINNTKESGEIMVMLRNEKEEIIFQVKNDAIDISKNKLSGLYSDYKEISADRDGTTEISKLAIAQRIAEELNASISCENNTAELSAITIKFRKQNAL